MKLRLSSKEKNKAIIITLLIISAIFIAVLIFNFQSYKLTPTSQEPNPEITINNTNFKISIADEPEEWSRGLMEIKQLEKRNGMLFIFPDENIRTFWMKNTYIPLDMIFMNSKMEIVKIYTNTQPLNTSILYSSEKPSKYVLEINAGESNLYNLQEGQTATSNIDNEI